MDVLRKADKDIFSVCQTVYSGIDSEMWFDWAARLSDTAWTDDCYDLMRDGVRIGGAIVHADFIASPFLAPPFCDRAAFWRALLALAGGDRRVLGVSDADAAVLQTLGYVVTGTKLVMCRPTEPYEAVLPAGFSCRNADRPGDVEMIAEAFVSGFAGSIAREPDGAYTQEGAEADVRYVLGVYGKKNFSCLVSDDATGTVAAACLAGGWDDAPLGYTELTDLCVLPAYRRRGLGRYLIDRTINAAHGVSPFVKLCATAGNRAIALYLDAGFQPGPRFTSLAPYRWKETDK